MLERPETSVSAKDNAGYTPLHEACTRGHLEVARLLLQYGASESSSAHGGIRYFPFIAHFYHNLSYFSWFFCYEISYDCCVIHSVTVLNVQSILDRIGTNSSDFEGVTHHRMYRGSYRLMNYSVANAGQGVDPAGYLY